MSLTTDKLVAFLIATSFAAGLNVYAMVATLGLLARAELLELPPALGVLASWYVIGACAVLFAMEFFADKVPYFDLIWNALQTFIRVPVAALVAYGATARLSPEVQLLSTLAGALIALAAHGGKLAARTAVTPSPEPVTNITFSLVEDAVAVFLTWFATAHPYWAAAIALAALLAIVVVLRAVVRALRSLFRNAGHALGLW